MRLTPRPTAIMLFIRTRGLAPRSPAWRAGGLLLTHARMRHPRFERGSAAWKADVLSVANAAFRGRRMDGEFRVGQKLRDGQGESSVAGDTFRGKFIGRVAMPSFWAPPFPFFF